MTSAALAPVSGLAADIVAMLPELRGRARMLLRGAQGQDDLVQDTVERALANLGSFTPGSHLGAWLYVIMRNVLVANWRKQHRMVADSDGKHAAKLRYEPSQLDRLEFEDVAETFQSLTRDHRSALLLVAVEGLSYGDAALLEHVAVGSMKSRVHRARRTLAEAVDPR